MKIKFTIAIVFALANAVSAQPLLSKSQNSGTPYDELNPVLTPDGRTLFITIANHPQNAGGRKDPGDIWYCTMGENDTWSEPIHAGPAINDRSFNGVAGFTSNGGEMILLSHYDPAGGIARTQGISVSKKNGNQWSRPENISIPYFQNKSSIVSGYLSADGKYFVYSAETYGTYGVEDLFVSFRKPDGKWSEPRNLGSRINTQFQELSPSLSADGKTLYFSTNGRKGKGSFDVYSAKRLDDTWTNWSDPENLIDLNTEGRDLFYREYPTLGFAIYTSTNNSDKYGEVKIHRPKTPMPIDTVVQEFVKVEPTEPKIEIAPVEKNDEDQADPHTILVHGKVINSKTSEPIPATITFVSESQAVAGPGVINAPASGYSVPVPSSTQYVVTIEAKGYISSREKLDVQTYQMKDLELNFNLQPIEVGTTVNLKDVLFEQSKTTLLPQSFPELDLVVAFMKANPDVKIELAGHTDNRGVPFQNVKLSEERVAKVKEYLVSKGIDAKRISGKGYGGSKPIANNNDEETRKLNRRVEFTIKKNG